MGTVFAPKYTQEKQEWWWAYLVMVDPVNITNLVDSEEFDVRFQAPSKPGMYNFTIYVRSDSYIELDVRHQFSITVHEPDAVPEPEPESEDEESNHEFITDSEAEPDVSSSSEYETDSE